MSNVSNKKTSLTILLYLQDMDPETEMAMLEAKAANTPMGQWTDDDWEQMANFAGGFSEDDFDFMSDTAVKAKYVHLTF